MQIVRIWNAESDLRLVQEAIRSSVSKMNNEYSTTSTVPVVQQVLNIGNFGVLLLRFPLKPPSKQLENLQQVVTRLTRLQSIPGPSTKEV